MRPHQVAEVIAGGRRGSGYLVSPDTVLTAWHAVAAGGPLRVRFVERDPIEVLQAHPIPDSDLAFLKINVVRGAQTAALARLTGDRPEPLTVHFAGFPRWKYRDGLRFRELYQGFGRLAPLSNRRTGMFELLTDPPAEDPEPGVSPWEGMSGAAVWHDDHLIGVVVEHHRREGLGRLTAHPLDQLPGVVDVAPAPPPRHGDTQINVATGNAVQINVQHGTVRYG